MTSLARTLKETKTSEDARAALESEVPPGTDADAARVWLTGRDIAFSDDGDALHFTVDGPRRGVMVSVRWIVTILLDDGKVTGVRVEEGLLGP